MISREPYINDSDLKIYVGDVFEVLHDLPEASIDCIVTSPPYWGLRDYGTGSWTGGDPHCQHRVGGQVQDNKALGAITAGVRPGVDASLCLDCGAHRIDQQLGLEPTVEMYVARMVLVFRELRRVLTPHGTAWLNLGDSYATTPIPSGLKPKDQVGVPWRVAFALQSDGWWLRSDIIWSKPNPMPESVTDRPTKSHEYIFLLTKSQHYYFDQEAVREPAEWARWGDQTNTKHEGSSSAASWITTKSKEELQQRTSGRNIRSVWEIVTQPYPEAHFATFPEELPRRAIKAGCPQEVCRVCGKPRVRIVDIMPSTEGRENWAGQQASKDGASRKGGFYDRDSQTVGWSDCSHGSFRAGVVLDPFAGSGTTCLVARNLGRHSIGVELNPEYSKLIAHRTQQLSLLT